MATLEEVIEEIKSYGSETTKKTLLKHGAKEPFYGTKIGDLKKIQKKIKNDQQLALQLYDSGISEAMYLAGLVANGAKMTRAQLNKWAKVAHWSMIYEFTVPWVASENPAGWELGLEWIDSAKENIAAAGWNTLSAWVTITPDEELDMKKLKALLKRVEKEIYKAPNRVRYTMNGFLISTGGYVLPLTEDVITTAARIGDVEVDMGDTSCKVPSVADYIEKMRQHGNLGKKRKTVKC